MIYAVPDRFCRAAAFLLPPFALLLVGLPAAITRASSEVNLPVIEEVIVVGRRPGPPLWRVTSADNTLWILATLKPLPKRLRWDSSSVKHLLTQASAYITPPNAQASTSNPFKAIAIMRKLKGLERLDGNAHLQDMVPASLFRRFLDLQSLYAGRRKDFASLRPMPAAEGLMAAAFKRVGLVNEDKIASELKQLAARKKGLETYSSTMTVDFEQVVEIFSSVAMADEIKCFEAALNTISVDLMASVNRANAWAAGDAYALLDLNYPSASRTCSRAIEDTPPAQLALKQSRDIWFANATQALANHEVSISSLPIEELATSNGLLARLRKAGYQIRGQQSEELDATTSAASNSEAN